MISALAWVPKGGCARNPARQAVSAAEMDMMRAQLEEAGIGDDEDGMRPPAMAAAAAARPDDDDDDDDDDGGDEDAMGESDDDEDEEEPGLEVDLAQIEREIDDGEEVVADSSALDADGLPASLNMDGYDDEPADIELMQGGGAGAAAAAEEEEEEDDGEAGEAASDDSDDEGNEVKPSDCVMLSCRTEDDFSCLEMQLYDEETGSLYVHHDITLPAFPLCCAWLNCAPEVPESAEAAAATRSHVAVGTFKQGIEIWDLDVLDPLEPAATLGGERQLSAEEYLAAEALQKKKVRKKDKKKKAAAAAAGPALAPGSHTDAVMCLAWSPLVRNVLASGGADNTVKVWDVTTQTCSHTFTHHTGKVQCVAWNPATPGVLATAAFDKTATVIDGRLADPSVPVCTLAIGGEAEALAWNPHAPSWLFVSTDDGSVCAFDTAAPRAGGAPTFTWRPHQKATAGIAFSPGVPGLVATCSTDRSIKVWDVQPGAEPRQLAEKGMGVGDLYGVAFHPSSPFLLVTGGSTGTCAIWEMDENPDIERHFRDRAPTAPKAAART